VWSYCVFPSLVNVRAGGEALDRPTQWHMVAKRSRDAADRLRRREDDREQGRQEENMHGRRSIRQFRLASLCLFPIFFSPFLGILTVQSEPPVGRSATPNEGGQAPAHQTVLWDFVVLGRIDACWVCQHGPPPHVSYTKVLAGKAPSGQPQGKIDLVEAPARLLPTGGIPIYKSQREEICYLKIVVLPSDKNAAAYKVVDVEEATPENLAKFKSVGKQ